MSFLTEIAGHLSDNSLGTLGTDLFINEMPETPSTCTAIFQTGGLAPQGGFGVSGILHERPGIQIRVRGEEYDDDTPQATIETIYNLLWTIQGTTLGSTKYLTVQANQAPFIMERDSNNRTVWAFNAIAEKELSS